MRAFFYGGRPFWSPVENRKGPIESVLSVRPVSGVRPVSVRNSFSQKPLKGFF